MLRLSLLTVLYVCLLARPGRAQLEPSDRCDTVQECTQRCDAGSAHSCSQLGLQYATGQGVGKDVVRAMALLDRACAGGAAKGCCNLGVLYAQKGDVKIDLQRAVQLYQQACNQGDLACCSNAGSMFMMGRGTRKNPARAESFFVRACEAGSAHGCFNLGLLYERLDAGKADASVSARAARAYERGCQGGHEDSCRSVPERAVSEEVWKAPASIELAPAKKVRLVVQGRVMEFDFPPRPWIDEEEVNLIPGEKLYVECVADGTRLRGLRRVDTVTDPSRTLELTFEQERAATPPLMLLTVKNPFSLPLKYEAAVQLQGQQEFRRTSTIVVRPGLFASESWPNPMTRIVLQGFRLLATRSH